MAQDDAGHNGAQQAQHVQGEDHQTRMLGEEGGGHQAVHRQTGRAGHEGHQHHGHTAVLLIFHGPRPHDGGDGTAKAHEHGDEGLTGQAEAAQHPVHDKGGPGHVPRVLQEGEEQEQQGNLGQEHQYAAHAGQHAVHQQRGHPGGGARLLQNAADHASQPVVEEVVHPVGQNLAGAEDDAKQDQHHHQKHGDRQEAVGDNGVNFIREGHGAQGLAPLHSHLHHPLNEAVAGVGNEGLPVTQGVGLFIALGHPVHLPAGDLVQP